MAAKKSKTMTLPVNRVEGDLELRLEIRDGVVHDAWCCGTMYRGFENMMKGRAPKDGLVITPRVCGICGTSHLFAAAKALDMICGVTIPVNALLVRNLTSMAEHLQSDMRHGLLMFMTNFIDRTYKQEDFYQEALDRYLPFHGTSSLQAIKSTKHIVEIVAIIGGQWPNSSYMVPGGVASTMSGDDIIACRYIISKFQAWYEQKILGCSIDRWKEVQTLDALDSWYEESESHRSSDVGFFIRCCRATGLDRIGGGHNSFISYGQFEYPETAGTETPKMLLAPGMYNDNRLEGFDQDNISEHVIHSKFEDYPISLHPFEGRTIPVADDREGIKYSFTKAPRYNNQPAETGPLAEMLCSENPLFTDIIRHQGPSVFSRQLARFTRGALLLPKMREWLDMIRTEEPFYSPIPYVPEGSGYGLTGGCRGALGHWVTIRNDVIEQYQIITPTAWNGSPRDNNHIRGPLEEAIIGTPVPDPDSPIMIGHVTRSFDPCQVCSVHMVKKE